MLIEQIIKVDGRNVTVIRKIEDTDASKVTPNTDELPVPASTVDLPTHYTDPLETAGSSGVGSTPAATTTRATAPRAMAADAPTGAMPIGPGGGSMDLGPGGGSMDLGPGGTGAGGITIVFGSVIVNCCCCHGSEPSVSKADDCSVDN